MRGLDLLRARPVAQRSYAESVFGAGMGGLGLDGLTTFSVGGQTYTVPVATSMPGQKAEAIGNSFEGYVAGGLMANSVVFSLVSVRLRVFSEARFQYQRLRNGRPGDLFGDATLSLLEEPWPGGTTGDLLAINLLHSDMAGNAYTTILNGQAVVMRPDWVEILLGNRYANGGIVGMEKLGYAYYHGGKRSGAEPVFFLADEVAHFAPQPDPLAWYRGMSWLTPVVREVRSDGAMVGHKLKYFENAATPNVAVSLKEITDPTQFQEFVDKMDESHKGWENAYKTLYLGGGADVTVIGANMQDFRTVQGAGEVRIAQAAGVPPSVAGLADSLEGATLNAGNFGQARRQFADGTLSSLWRNVSGSFTTLVPGKPANARLWIDTRDVPFLREDQKDEAEIRQLEAQSIRELFIAGFTPDSSVAAVMAGDWSLLKHTGTYSVQVQSPGTTSTKLPATTDTPPTDPEGSANATEKPLVPAVSAPGAPPAGNGQHA